MLQIKSNLETVLQGREWYFGEGDSMKNDLSGIWEGFSKLNDRLLLKDEDHETLPVQDMKGSRDSNRI